VIRLSGAVEDKRAPAPVADAVSALINLGYGEIQASSAVAAAMRSAGDKATAEALIRASLKELAR
jgi:Holliday junction DNA helicase RuvA